MTNSHKYICIHGHFYQPPRENPWLDEVEVQDSAYPYHDWNERITVECYARNAAARILDSNKNITDIVNNYSKISLDFGPTLLSWMERKNPETYHAVLEADRMSQQYFSGHGSAMAQVYNHLIMPLANTRDKRTQIVWGIRDFEYRFKRKPEGMWLAETAVDMESLDMMAEQGIIFTVLAPSQAKRVRPIGDHGQWKEVRGERIDPKMPYLCQLPSGRTISIFFYDGPISRGVAFEGLLNNGDVFAERLMKGFDNSIDRPQIMHIATDGETYGHHHKFGDMALAYCLEVLERKHHAKLTVYGEFLEKFPPTYEVEIFENTSWSCAHGVERWRSNCGCNIGSHAGFHQQWRAPLRKALDWLRDKTAPVYEQNMAAFVSDVWRLRDVYIELILNRDKDAIDQFLMTHIGRSLNLEEKIRVLKLLETQHHALLMYTSCGWFFDDIAGIETVQIMKYAARVIQLVKELSGTDLESQFVDMLGEATGNLPELKDGGVVYRNTVQPAIVDLLRVGAHYAMTSLYERYPQNVTMYCYAVQSDMYDVRQAGRLSLAVGRGWVSSDITLEKSDISFSVLHFGDHNFIGAVADLKPAEFSRMHKEIFAAFLESNIPEVIGLINHYFGSQNYSLWDLFKQEQQKILNMVLQSTTDDIEQSFRQIYEHHYPLMQIKNEIKLPLPRTLMAVVEFILNRDLSELLQAQEIDLDRLQSLVEEMKRWSFKRDQASFSFAASQRISTLMTELMGQPLNLDLMETVERILTILAQLNLEIDLWKAQNIYFSISKQVYIEKKNQARLDANAEQWVRAFNSLGDVLQVKIIQA